MNLSLAVISFIFYLIAAVQIAPLQNRLFINHKKYIFLLLTLMAVSVHGLLIYSLIREQNAINLGIFNALTLIAWVNNLLLLILLLFRPVEKLALVLYPLAALSMLPALLFNSEHLIPDNLPWGLNLHIALSMLAYALLALSFVQAVFTSTQDYCLRHKQLLQFICYLPALKGMEILFFQLTSMGLFILSLSLGSGIWFLSDVHTQQLSHKLILSAIAWCIFCWLLLQHWRQGRRVRQSLLSHSLAFLVLNLGYFGSKLVLELLL